MRSVGQLTVQATKKDAPPTPTHHAREPSKRDLCHVRREGALIDPVKVHARVVSYVRRDVVDPSPEILYSR